MVETIHKERQWTKRELEWKERLANHPVFELTTVADLYARTPAIDATELLRKIYGHGGTGWCKFIMAYNALQQMGSEIVCLLHAPLNCNGCIRNYKGDYL